MVVSGGLMSSSLSKLFSLEARGLDDEDLIILI